MIANSSKNVGNAVVFQRNAMFADKHKSKMIFIFKTMLYDWKK